MAVSLTPIFVSNNDTFQMLIALSNTLVTTINTVVMTANSDANGSQTTGNSYLIGQFGANVLVVYDTLRGGNFTTAGTLTLGSNLDFQAMTLAGNSGALINIGTTVSLNSSFLVVPAVNVSANATSGFQANTTAIVLNNKTYTNLDPHIIVANNGTNVGDQPRINFVSGGAISLTAVNEVSNNMVTVTISVNGASLGLGFSSNTQVLFNDSSSSNGSAGLTFDKTTNNLTLGNTFNLTSLRIGSTYTQNSVSQTVQTASQVILDFWPLTDFRAADYCLTVKDNTANAHQVVRLLLIHDAGTASLAEFGTVSTNTDIATFATTVNATHAHLLYTGATANTTIKGSKVLIST